MLFVREKRKGRKMRQTL